MVGAPQGAFLFYKSSINIVKDYNRRYSLGPINGIIYIYKGGGKDGCKENEI